MKPASSSIYKNMYCLPCLLVISLIVLGSPFTCNKLSLELEFYVVNTDVIQTVNHPSAVILHISSLETPFVQSNEWTRITCFIIVSHSQIFSCYGPG